MTLFEKSNFCRLSGIYDLVLNGGWCPHLEYAYYKESKSNISLYLDPWEALPSILVQEENGTVWGFWGGHKGNNIRDDSFQTYMDEIDVLDCGENWECFFSLADGKHLAFADIGSIRLNGSYGLTSRWPTGDAIFVVRPQPLIDFKDNVLNSTTFTLPLFPRERPSATHTTFSALQASDLRRSLELPLLGWKEIAPVCKELFGYADQRTINSHIASDGLPIKLVENGKIKKRTAFRSELEQHKRNLCKKNDLPEK